MWFSQVVGVFGLRFRWLRQRPGAENECGRGVFSLVLHCVGCCRTVLGLKSIGWVSRKVLVRPSAEGHQYPGFINGNMHQKIFTRNRFHLARENSPGKGPTLTLQRVVSVQKVGVFAATTGANEWTYVIHIMPGNVLNRCEHLDEA